MNTVQVKNTVIGEGRPKICVPIVGKTKTDILEEKTFLFSLHSVLPKKAVRKKFL